MQRWAPDTECMAEAAAEHGWAAQLTCPEHSERGEPGDLVLPAQLHLSRAIHLHVGDSIQPAPCLLLLHRLAHMHILTALSAYQPCLQ